jgi:hypothetical protein
METASGLVWGLIAWDSVWAAGGFDGVMGRQWGLNRHKPRHASAAAIWQVVEMVVTTSYRPFYFCGSWILKLFVFLPFLHLQLHLQL